LVRDVGIEPTMSNDGGFTVPCPTLEHITGRAGWT
jgi:hypothetical protein